MTSLPKIVFCASCAGATLLLAAALTSPDRVTRGVVPDSISPNPRDISPRDISPKASSAAPARVTEDGTDSEASACVDTPSCIERYLWTVYERTPKIDAGGQRFAWKDAEAAEKAGMPLERYVIGGMDPFFRVTLYRALRILDAAGFRPGIMCGFRDDYRQSITTGKMRAANDRSFHGGSLRGGYGYGTAADIVSVKGDTASARSDSTGRMWDWIDRHEKELGIGRPYLARDPPHVAPLDGEEYAAHRLGANARHGGLRAAEQAADRRARRSEHAPARRNGDSLKNAARSATRLTGGVSVSGAVHTP